jgi:hypothetical protein
MPLFAKDFFRDLPQGIMVFNNNNIQASNHNSNPITC